MPIYEYQCRRCGKVTALMERRGAWWGFFRRKCSHCGRRRLDRIYSSFSTSRKRSMSDLMGEMSRMGHVNFVPSPPRPLGPPPGGCPYAKEEKNTVGKKQ